MLQSSKLAIYQAVKDRVMYLHSNPVALTPTISAWRSRGSNRLEGHCCHSGYWSVGGNMQGNKAMEREGVRSCLLSILIYILTTIKHTHKLICFHLNAIYIIFHTNKLININDHLYKSTLHTLQPKYTSIKHNKIKGEVRKQNTRNEKQSLKKICVPK